MIPAETAEKRGDKISIVVSVIDLQANKKPVGLQIGVKRRKGAENRPLQI